MGHLDPLPSRYVPRRKLATVESSAAMWSCYRCGGFAYTRVSAIEAVPEGHCVQLGCPDPQCRAPNVFLRVPAPDYLADADEYTDPAGRWFGKLQGTLG